MDYKLIREKFAEYGGNVTSITENYPLLKIEFNKKDSNSAFGSVTIDYMYDHGYRVNHWNFSDGIATIVFKWCEE